jgi:enoyl-CoA hydratase/carnithine racemase
MKLWDSPKPVIGQIEGWAIGGATDLALCCDQLFMADDAVIGYPPARIFGAPTTMLWIYRLGLERAKQYLLTGAEIDAPTALRIGLVSEVVAHEDLLPTATALARKIAERPPLAVAKIKEGMRSALDPDWTELGAWVSTSLAGLFQTEDHREGVKSFLEKRPPQFVGR